LLATVLTALDHCRNETTGKFDPVSISANDSAKVVGEIFGFQTSDNGTHCNTTMVRRAPNMGLFFGNSDNEGAGNSKAEAAGGGAISGSGANGTVSLRFVLTFVLICVGGIAFGLGC
jgi:hypothetical protein